MAEFSEAQVLAAAKVACPGVDWREPDAIRAEMMRDAHFNPVTAEHFADHEVQRCAEARVYALDLTRRILAAAVEAGDDA